MGKTFSANYRWYIFALCAAIFIISQFWRVSNAVVANDLSRDLGLTPESLGLLGGAFFYSFCLVQLPMGFLLDRFGARAVMSTLACIGAASAVIFAFAGGAATAILARAGIGIGMAAALMGSYKIFTAWFSPQEFATLSGIMIALGNMGAMSATAPLALLSELLGWRGAFLCMAAVTLSLAVTIYLVVRDHPERPAASQIQPPLSVSGIFSGLLTVLGDSRFWRLAPLSFASYGVMITILGLWGGPYLRDVCGLSKTSASVILLATPVGAVCGAPLWGRLSDILKRRKYLILFVQGVSLLLLSSLVMDLHLPRWGLLVQYWLFGFAGVSSTLLYVQVKETFPLSIAGTALTGLNFFLMLGGAVFQHMMGIIMGHWTPSATGALPVTAYQWGFGVSAAVLALTLIVYIGSHDTTPESVLT
ncbi:MAG: MFS transporter [Deltaproteobacteria bacterium]|nr:MFS transporter [Deltaproteobacteria bacterium]